MRGNNCTQVSASEDNRKRWGERNKMKSIINVNVFFLFFAFSVLLRHYCWARNYYYRARENRKEIKSKTILICLIIFPLARSYSPSLSFFLSLHVRHIVKHTYTYTNNVIKANWDEKSAKKKPNLRDEYVAFRRPGLSRIQ